MLSKQCFVCPESSVATPSLPISPETTTATTSQPLNNNNCQQEPLLPNLPPQPSSSSSGSSSSRRSQRRHRHNSPRFQTQPITIDEVEMASARNRCSSSPEMLSQLRPNQFLHSFSSTADSSSFSEY